MTPEQEAEIRKVAAWYRSDQPLPVVLRALDATRAELADFREGAAVEARAADAARAEVARVRTLAEGWRSLAADLRGSDEGRHPSDMAQARVFERCAREVLGG